MTLIDVILPCPLYSLHLPPLYSCGMWERVCIPGDTIDRSWIVNCSLLFLLCTVCQWLFRASRSMRGKVWSWNENGICCSKVHTDNIFILVHVLIWRLRFSTMRLFILLHADQVERKFFSLSCATFVKNPASNLAATAPTV